MSNHMGALGQVIVGANRPPPPRRFAAGGPTGQPPDTMGAGIGGGPDALALMMLLNGQLPPIGGAAPQQTGQGANGTAPPAARAAASYPVPPTPPPAPPQQPPAGGALGTAGAGVDPSTGGALARADARAQKLAAITRAQRVLQAGGAAQPVAAGTPQPAGGTVVNGVPFAPGAGAPGAAPMNTQIDPALAATLNAASGGGNATNLSELAAAGAMLAPTHTGTLSESIGNAFRAAVPVAQAQRKLASDAALRLQQQQWMESYRKEMLGDRGRGLDIQAQRAQAEVPMYTARAAYFSAVAAARTAGHATSGDIEAQTIQNLMKQTNPTTGKPYTQPEAFAAFRALGQKPTAEHVTWVGNTKDGAPILLNTATGTETIGSTPIGMKTGTAARLNLAQEELALRQQVASGRLTAEQQNTVVHLMSADRNVATGAPNHPLDYYIDQAKKLHASTGAPPLPMAPATAPMPTAPAAAAGAEAQGTRANPWKVLLPSEAAKLPPGSWYMAPNGRTYQRSNTPGG